MQNNEYNYYILCSFFLQDIAEISKKCLSLSLAEHCLVSDNTRSPSLVPPATVSPCSILRPPAHDYTTGHSDLLYSDSSLPQPWSPSSCCSLYRPFQPLSQCWDHSRRVPPPCTHTPCPSGLGCSPLCWSSPDWQGGWRECWVSRHLLSYTLTGRWLPSM